MKVARHPALNNKIALVGIVEYKVCFGVIANLLEQGATVIVPAQSSFDLQLLDQYLKGIKTGRLVTVLTDFPDYDKSVELVDTILEEYGPLDIVVTSFDYLPAVTPLSETSLREWEKTVEENIAISFICTSITIQSMKKKQQGMFVMISDTDSLSWQPQHALSGIAAAAQIEMSRRFFEEVKKSGIKYYQLFVNHVVKRRYKQASTTIRSITPDVVGKYILQLYNGQVPYPENLFQFLLGKPWPAMEQYTR